MRYSDKISLFLRKLQKPLAEGECGSAGLTTALMASLIVGLLAAGTTGAIDNYFKARADLNTAGELSILQEYVKRNISCYGTYFAANKLDALSTDRYANSCRGPITLVSGTKDPLAPDGKIGDWNVSAECRDHQLKITVSKPTSERYSRSRPLFGKEYVSCGEIDDIFIYRAPLAELRSRAVWSESHYAENSPEGRRNYALLQSFLRSCNGIFAPAPGSGTTPKAWGASGLMIANVACRRHCAAVLPATHGFDGAFGYMYDCGGGTSDAWCFCSK